MSVEFETSMKPQLLPCGRTIHFAKMSTTPAPLSPKFVPAEKSGITSVLSSVWYHITFWLRTIVHNSSDVISYLETCILR
uniref:Uncharacterized protein n=1 Tax=Solanum lycopersicum TaxID=4081 RepID=A0A3Q7HQD1_SOLLC